MLLADLRSALEGGSERGHLALRQGASLLHPQVMSGCQSSPPLAFHKDSVHRALVSVQQHTIDFILTRNVYSCSQEPALHAVSREAPGCSPCISDGAKAIVHALMIDPLTVAEAPLVPAG